MIMSRGSLVLLVMLIVFTSGFWAGSRIALNKPLWNDEIYSQMRSIDSMSWAGIWSGRIREGNNSPVFYSVQKVVCAAFGYQTADLWKKDDVRSRFLLRLAPIMCMSLGLAVIVGFFCAYYSFLGGLIAFIIAISSYMVWYFWAEARPYAFVFLATALQSVFFLYACRFSRSPRYGVLGLLNLLLALVTSIGVIQIVAIGVILWFNGYRRFWALTGCVGLPFLIALGYYAAADHYQFKFVSWGMPLALIELNIPAGRLAAFFIFPLLIWGWDRYINKDRTFFLWPFFLWAWLTVAGYALFLGYLYFRQRPPQGFEVTGRYLMSLTPIGIVCLTAAILEFLKRP
ncbi:MAG: hypothetical protein HQL22_11390, partial [Candidatus Omnitrophica bacterium]|nr:hypothetical protein [Candidatus Omnitrophota bacterium]